MVFKSIYPDVTPPAEYQDSFSLYVWRQLDKHAERELLVDHESGRTWTGAEMKKVCRDVAGLFIEEMGLGPRDCVLQFSRHDDYLHLSGIAAILAGASVAYWTPEETIWEKSNAIKALKPKIVCVEADRVEETKLIGESTGVSFKILVINDTKDSSSLDGKQVFGLHTHVIIWLGRQSYQIPELPVIVSPDDPCYIIMTSGSTGRPKPLGRSHKNCLYLCHTAPQVPKLWSLHENMVLAGHLPPDHGTGTFSIKMTIALGSKLIIMPGYSEPTLLSAIEKHKITDIMLGSALLHNLMLSDKVNNRDLSSVVNMIAVGSPLVSHDVAVAFMNKYPHLSVRQGFGMTEAAFLSMVPRAEAMMKRRTVGYILPNIKIKLLDLETDEEITKFDQKGELYVSTPTLSPGYLGEELKEQTRAVFQGDGFYRSYDMASMSEDSQLTLYGRRNEILDLYDGLKVLPSEIEEYIMRLPGVREAAVIGIPSKEFPGCNDVKAFVSIKDGTKLGADDIIKWVAGGLSLPKHLSGGCVILDSLPKVSLGKVNKKVLRAM